MKIYIIFYIHNYFLIVVHCMCLNTLYDVLAVTQITVRYFS